MSAPSEGPSRLELPETITLDKGITMTFLRDAPFLTRVHISSASDTAPFHVPLHYHTTHDEVFRVVKGKLRITMIIDGKTEKKVCTPEDGEVIIPKGVVHGVDMKGLEGTDTVIEEKTDPMDDQELFFRNICSSFDKSLLWMILGAMQACYYGDTTFVLPIRVDWLEKALAALLGYYIPYWLGLERKYKSLR